MTRIASAQPGPVRVLLRVIAAAVWAVLAATCLLVLDPLCAGVVGALGCAVLVAVSVVDLERMIIPNVIIRPAIAVALVVQTFRDPGPEWIVSALAAGGFFLVLVLVYPAGLGMGDVRLAAFLGAWLGWDVVVALFVGSLLALVPALVVLARSGLAGRKQALPYGPFLAAGGVVALFAGERVMDAWLG